MKILVTGGLGYIGSHTVLHLIENDFVPIIADDLSNSNKEVLDVLETISGKNITFHEIDLKNQNELAILNSDDFEGVVHFAAHKSVGESVAEPIKYYENNLFSLINTLKFCETNFIKRFVFSSSCTVYGQPKSLPIYENFDFIESPSPYGKSKQICENILRDCVTNKGISAIALRYFNPIGAHTSGDLGELQKNHPQNIVPLIAKNAVGQLNKLVIHGGDYDTVDGTAIRDYIDINDLADAHVAALKRTLYKKNDTEPFEFFNLGKGKGVSVLELIKTFEKVTGVDINYEVNARRLGDVQEVYADNTKAKSILGWEAKTSIETSLLSAYLWEKNRANN
jgi:UDP-glucose 4-epimerase